MQAAIFLALALLLATARAHPIPDIPVRTFFPGDGSMRVTVEVDPRCFAADPDLEASLLPARLAEKTPEQRAELERKAAELAQRWIEFTLEPIGRVQPDFRFTFSGKGETPLSGAEDVVVLTGEWRTTLAAGLSGWRIRSLPEAKLSVVFQNIIRGQTHPRLAVLFPGESSFTLDLAGLATTPALPDGTRVATTGTRADGWSTFVTFLRQGFVHVVPEGVDHILFVLGLFLLSRAWRPLLAQVTTFTLAHSVTLALATLGYVKVPASIVEPVIAASIAVVALENIFHPRYTHWRLLVVFVFGLIHGLGFASVLSDLDLPGSTLVAGLVGFNLGVEGGQLAVIAAAFLATAWLREPARYRRWIVIPGSAAIAFLGVWWAVERITGS
jgi:hypothetical protein